MTNGLLIFIGLSPVLTCRFEDEQLIADGVALIGVHYARCPIWLRYRDYHSSDIDYQLWTTEDRVTVRNQNGRPAGARGIT